MTFFVTLPDTEGKSAIVFHVREMEMCNKQPLKRKIDYLFFTCSIHYY